MTESETQPNATTRPGNSPRSAAAAGILFAILFTASMVLIHLSLPDTVTTNTAWVIDSSGQLRIALLLVPFSGIAFLWFVGVIRDHLGLAEDRLFATVFLGSSLLFLAMVFVSAAIAGGIISSAGVIQDQQFLQSISIYSRSVMLQINNVYAMRMAAVVMTSLASIWLRTGRMPRWLGIATFVLALILLLVTSLNLWVTLIFPTWVLVISVYILVLKMREKELESS